MAKTYSVTIKGRRIDFTDADLAEVKKGPVQAETSKQIVHLFAKTGRVDVPKADFDKAVQQKSDTQKPA